MCPVKWELICLRNAMMLELILRRLKKRAIPQWDHYCSIDILYLSNFAKELL